MTPFHLIMTSKGKDKTLRETSKYKNWRPEVRLTLVLLQVIAGHDGRKPPITAHIGFVLTAVLAFSLL